MRLINRCLGVKFRPLDVNFRAQEVVCVFKMPMEFISGPLGVNFGPLRVDLRAMQGNFWPMDGDFWL